MLHFQNPTASTIPLSQDTLFTAVAFCNNLLISLLSLNPDFFILW